MEQNQFEFKPFDKVLVRDSDQNIWKASIFSHYDEKSNTYVCVGSYYIQCIPYNEETAHLVGTKKPYKKPEPKVWTVKTEEDQIQSFTHDDFIKLIEDMKKTKCESILIIGYTGNREF